MKQKKQNNYFSKAFSVLGLVTLLAAPLSSQTLVGELDLLFNRILDESISGSGQQGRPFAPDNNGLSRRTINAFRNFTMANLFSFPLNSTAAGLTFDLSSGQPMSMSGSLGPIFAERAQTLGKGRFNIGLNYSYLSLGQMRGIQLSDLRFTFVHNDVGEQGLGDLDREFDTIDVLMDVELNTAIVSFVGTVGITDQLDLGIVVPFHNVHLKTTTTAFINSHTFARSGQADYFFGGTSQEPLLSENFGPRENTATGAGDIALRAKYHFLKEYRADLAALLELRLATGNERNFLGSGDDAIKFSLIGSAAIKDISTHINLAYERRTSTFDRDEIEIFIGYDQKVWQRLTLALDFLGEIEIGGGLPDIAFPKDFVIRENSAGSAGLVKFVSASNIPDFQKDHHLNASIGFKYAMRDDLIFISNAFLPLNDGGLRSEWVPTIGFDFSF